MTTAREPISMVGLLSLANDKGEIGYVYGGDDIDLRTVDEAKARGFIRYAYDASQSKLAYGDKAQKRTVYLITGAGRAHLREAKP